jgi:predicted transposase YbfD/YdcC
MNFAYSIPDFRRTDKGNHRHKLGDIILLIILARMSKCIGRADMIEFGNQNLRKFQSMNMLRNGVPSEPTLCRVENGIDSTELANRMAEFSKIFHDELIDGCDQPEIINIDGKAMCGTVQGNGRNPDIVSAYSPSTGITLATEVCKEKSNEIKAVPLLLDKIDIAGKLVTADAMSMQKEIIDKIREKGGYFLIELKANQRALRYGVEDRIKQCIHKFSHKEDFKLEHGRIEARTYKVYDGLELIVDKDKWGGNLTVVEFISNCTKKSTGAETSETRFYVSNLPNDTPWIGMAVRKHWAIESMHWGLDFNLLQDSIKRKTTKAARNLDTLQRIVYSLFSIWKGRRKKRSDKAKGLAKLMRHVSRSFTNLLHFLSQK